MKAERGGVSQEIQGGSEAVRQKLEWDSENTWEMIAEGQRKSTWFVYRE